MLAVKTPEEVWALIATVFAPLPCRAEEVPLAGAVGRILAADIAADEYVPDFDRSTVDGFALRAADTFGCSEAIPAVLTLCGEVRMGSAPDFVLPPGGCAAVPTGGALPKGADSVVMLEYAEDYGDGAIGIGRPAAPGQNLIFRGDDVAPGEIVLKAGRLLAAEDIGALAAIGRLRAPVRPRLRVAVLSTGDELVAPEAAPGPGQVRDVNGPMLAALLAAYGAEPAPFGIVADEEAALRRALEEALAGCDAVLLSGGSSVGEKDAAARVIASLGETLLHGIAIKPGKPTILARAGNKPLVGLPGHPAAACLTARLFALPLLARLEGREWARITAAAELAESVPANHGRAQVNACRLFREGERLIARPIHSKSGLITGLAGADGHFLIDRDCEGLPKGAVVQVTRRMGD